MTNRIILTALLIAMASQANAGTVRLINDSWDNIPEIVTIEGINAPNDGRNHSYSNIRKGQTIGEFEDRVCIKRTRNPSDPSSGLTNSWDCYQQLISGTNEVKL